MYGTKYKIPIKFFCQSNPLFQINIDISQFNPSFYNDLILILLPELCKFCFGSINLKTSCNIRCCKFNMVCYSNFLYPFSNTFLYNIFQ